LHAAKLDDNASGQARFVRAGIDRLDQSLLGQTDNERTPGADSLGHNVKRQGFIKIEISCPHYLSSVD
jgi:hypothetical protein